MRSPAALVSIEPQPKWAQIRIGRRTAFATILMQSIMGSTALWLTAPLPFSFDRFDIFIDSFMILLLSEEKKNIQARRTPMQGNIAGAGADGWQFRIKIPGFPPGPEQRRLSLCGLALKICSLKKKRHVSVDLYVLNLEWSIRRGKKNIGKICDDFLLEGRVGIDMGDVHPAQITLTLIGHELWISLVKLKLKQIIIIFTILYYHYLGLILWYMVLLSY